MQSFEGLAKCAIGNVKVVITHKKVFSFQLLLRTHKRR